MHILKMSEMSHFKSWYLFKSVTFSTEMFALFFQTEGVGGFLVGGADGAECVGVGCGRGWGAGSGTRFKEQGLKARCNEKKKDTNGQGTQRTTRARQASGWK